MQVTRLKQENALLKEQFLTWALHAERKGVTMSMLNAPLPKPNRDQTKEGEMMASGQQVAEQMCPMRRSGSTT